jgi:hypothetical protein
VFFSFTAYFLVILFDRSEELRIIKLTRQPIVCLLSALYSLWLLNFFLFPCTDFQSPAECHTLCFSSPPLLVKKTLLPSLIILFQ